MSSTPIQVPPISISGQPHDPVIVTGIKGLNNSLSDEFIDPQELAEVENYELDINQSGVLIKRTGITKNFTTSLTEAVTSIYDGINGDYFSTSTILFTLNGTERLSGLSSTTDPAWTTYTDITGAKFDIFANGAQAPRKTSNGTTFAVVGGSPPSFTDIESYNNMLFGITGNTLRWSQFGEDDIWPAANSLTFDNAPTALRVYKNVLILFTNNEVRHIQAYSEVDVQITYYSTDDGCTSHRSVVVTPFGLFWWSKNGLVMSQDAQTMIYPVKNKIPSTLNNLNFNRFSLIHGLWNVLEDRLEYFVFNLGSTTIDKKIYFYPRREEALFIGTGDGVKMGASAVVLESGKPNVYVGSAATGKFVYKQTGDTDDGISVTSTLTTKRIAPVNSNALKLLRRLTVRSYIAGNVISQYKIMLDDLTDPAKTWDLSYASLKGSSGFLLDTDILDSKTLTEGVQIPKDTVISLAVRYRKIRHKIVDSSSYRNRFIGIVTEGLVLTT